MNPYANSPALPPEIKAAIDAALAAQAQAYEARLTDRDAMISRLESNFDSLTLPATPIPKPSKARFQQQTPEPSGRTFCGSRSEPPPQPRE